MFKTAVMSHCTAIGTKKAIQSAKERIEAWPDITKTEMGWYRSKPGELKPAANKREAEGFTYPPPSHNDRSHIHTHLLDGARKWGGSMPSPEDFGTTALLLAQWNLRAWHIASIDDCGMVAGYVSYAPTDDFVRLAKEYQALLPGMLKYSVFDMEESAGKKEFLTYMLRKAFVRLHIKPMPGYRFDAGEGVFAKL